MLGNLPGIRHEKSREHQENPWPKSILCSLGPQLISPPKSREHPPKKMGKLLPNDGMHMMNGFGTYDPIESVMFLQTNQHTFWFLGIAMENGETIPI